MTTLSIKNIGKTNSPRWKFVSKFLCRVLPVIAGAIATVPITPSLKVWLIFACTVIVSIISTLSELTSQ